MGRYRNPILPGCHPDPSICRVGDDFYLITSTFEYLPGLPIHRSRNLVDWELVGHAIHREGQLDLSAVPSSKGLYAPTIRHKDGRFFVVCTVVAAPGRPVAREGHFLVTATDPAGPWSDPIWFDGFTGIDPSLTFDGDRVWLCGTRQADPGLWPGQADIWLTELDPHTFVPFGDRRYVWRGALDRAGWSEGPHILPHPDGGWMLVAAEGGTDRDHAVSVAYADGITGPYVGDVGNPRLTHRNLGDRAPIANVGHADLVDAPDGRTWAVVLGTQTHDGENALMGRQTHLVPVEWERGRPLFAPGVGRVEPEVDADGVPDQAPPARMVVDDFDGASLDLAWNAVRAFPESFADLSARPGAVRLAATCDEPSTVGRTAFLGRRLPASRVRIGATLELVDGPGGLRAGILLRTSELGYLELTVDRDGAVRAAVGEDGTHEVVATAVAPASGPLSLALTIDGYRVDLSVGGEYFGTADARPLATGRTSWFVGSWVGPFAVGDGFADVDRVEVELLG